jgi:6-phosphogluconolactonase
VTADPVRAPGATSPAGSTPDDRGEPEITVFDTAEALADGAAEWIASALSDAIDARGAAHFALAGGSSPVATYRVLARRDLGVQWPAVHLWWSDDRYVPPDHPQSNAGLVLATLLEADEEKTRGADVPAHNVHEWPIAEAIEAGHDADWAASEYAEEVLRHVPAVDGRPVFDVLLLGVGPDGHVMSLFPGSPGLQPDAPLTLAVPAPTHVEPHLPRVTFRGSVADDARNLLVLVNDPMKANVVAGLLGGPRDPGVYPGELARRRGANWLLTRDCALWLLGGESTSATLPTP